MERYSMSTYTRVTNFQKTARFLAHPVHISRQAVRTCNPLKGTGVN